MTKSNTIDDTTDVALARRWLAAIAKHGDARVQGMGALAAELKGFGVSERVALTLLGEALRARQGGAS